MAAPPAETPAKMIEKRRAERRQKAIIGPLPESFLRLPGVDDEPMTAEERDHEMAAALQKQLAMENPPMAQGMPVQANVIGRLTITVVEAKLTKNYGVTRMDPYARVRLGHNVYETPTCPNGSKEPKWNKTINCFLIAGAKNIDVEIYDECTFSPDSLVAHTTVPIPNSVMQSQQMVDDWWPLSGQEGLEKEGMIHLILSMQPIPAGAAIYSPQMPQTGSVPNASGGKPMAYTGLPLNTQVYQPAAGTVYQPAPGTVYQPVQPGVGFPPQHQMEHRPPEPVEMSPEDLEEFSKMFPAIEKSIIQAVFVESGGDKEATVNSLLQMGQ